MSNLNLDTESVLFRVRITPDGLNFLGGRFYVCPECGEGHVTDHGGNVYLCGVCDYQH